MATRKVQPFILMGQGETGMDAEKIHEFGPAGSLEKLDGEAARKKIAESNDPKVVKPAVLKTPPKTAPTADGSDLAPTAAG